MPVLLWLASIKLWKRAFVWVKVKGVAGVGDTILKQCMRAGPGADLAAGQSGGVGKAAGRARSCGEAGGNASACGAAVCASAADAQGEAAEEGTPRDGSRRPPGRAAAATASAGIRSEA